MLTSKQEKFIQELLKGKSQREAYKIAYPASQKWKVTAIDSQASRLFKHSEVNARFEQLNRAALERTADTAESMRAFIIETYKKIASGEICDETTELDADGNILRTRKSRRASDVSTALSKLAEYYGVSPEVNIQHDVSVVFSDEIERYSD